MSGDEVAPRIPAQERLRDGNAPKFRQYLAAFIASLGGLSLGVSLGWNSSTSELLKNYMNADSLELGLAGGIFNLGVCIGLGTLPFVLRSFSRIGAMTLTVPIVFLGWGCIAFSGQTVALLLFGRTICGFSGAFCVLTPIYIAELADQKIRGSLLAVFQLMINFGIMFSYTAAHFTSEEETIWMYSIVCALTTAPVTLAIFLPETSLYHLIHGDEEKAKTSLRYFRGKDYSAFDIEMDQLKRLVAIKESKRIVLSTLGERRVLKSLVTSFGVMMMHQFSGISPVIFYTMAFFQAEGAADISSSEQTLVVGSVQILSSIIAIILMDTVGRKVLLIISSLIMGICLVLLGWYFRVQQDDPEFADGISWMPLTWISLLFGAFNLGVGPIAWIFVGEIFPGHVKLGAATTMAMVNWLVCLTLTLTFGEILNAIGEVNTMWLFAVLSWTGTVFSVVFVTETKLLSSLELQGETGDDETSDL